MCAPLVVVGVASEGQPLAVCCVWLVLCVMSSVIEQAFNLVLQNVQLYHFSRTALFVFLCCFVIAFVLL